MTLFALLKPSAPPTAWRRLGTPLRWIEFGNDLLGLELNLDEEAGLDAHAKAALAVARVMALCGPEPREDQVGLDPQSKRAQSAWIHFGLELSALDLRAEEEGKLDALSKVTANTYPW